MAVPARAVVNLVEIIEVSEITRVISAHSRLLLTSITAPAAKELDKIS